jgi:hypothetical protein
VASLVMWLAGFSLRHCSLSDKSVCHMRIR